MEEDYRIMGVLRERRNAAGLTQKQLAEMAGVHVRCIAYWEKVGIEHASVGNAKPVADALGLWIDQLVTDEHDEGEDDEEATA